MSYSSITDFLALLRQTSGGVRTLEMPGLDYMLSALSRAGFITLSVGQAAPTSNQPTTVWLKPASPSWSAEGSVFLWNASAVPAQYQLATPALWIAYFSSNGYLFQSAAQAANVINSGTTLLAVQRAAPAATALTLPNLTSQWLSGRPLKIVDFSTAVVAHTITLTPPDTATIMSKASWQLLSTADQLAGVVLHPSPDLNAWVITP